MEVGEKASKSMDGEGGKERIDQKIEKKKKQRWGSRHTHPFYRSRKRPLE